MGRLRVTPRGDQICSLRNRRHWTQEELAQQVGCSKRTVERLEDSEDTSIETLSEIARALGVEIEEILCSELGLPLRCPALEEDLRRRFGLREAVVIDVSALLRADLPEADRRPYSDYDGQLHRLLGRAAAATLASLARPGDVIGVGGGRAVRSCAEAFVLTGNLPARVVSFVGHLSVGLGVAPPPSGFDAYTDADQVASLLAAVLERAELQRVGQPLAPESGAPCVPHLGEVSLSVFGLGVLCKGHPLLRVQKNPNLAQVATELTTLHRIVQELEKGKDPVHHCVADITNDLFLPFDSRLAPWRSVLGDDLCRLTEAVNAVNLKTVTARSADRAGVVKRGAAVLVAGGPHKVSAIEHVLRQCPPWVSHLVTDDESARLLINER